MKTIILIGILVASHTLLLVKNETSQILALKGVPDIPWCKKGQDPKRGDKCRNGRESGGLYLPVEVEA
ncbi:hypothetical protein CAL7716_102510 (plasmid) [Calothrix sp. PCC 7716]|nr:hypothetical protein CAL7716_102510 [Calothrix sp. PCC 7716]